MRILGVAHSYPRWEGDVAGAFIARLMSSLQQRGHHVSMVVPADGGVGGSHTLRGIPVHRVRYALASHEHLAYHGQMVEATRSVGGAFSFGALVASQSATTLKLTRAERFEIVHAHWWIPGGVACWAASFATQRPYVVTLHGTDARILDRARWLRGLAVPVLRRAAAVTTVSTFLADRVAEVGGLDRRKIVVQPMPLDVERYDRLSVGGGGIVTVGRLVEQKRIGAVLEALSLLRRENTALSLTVVGEGPERRALEYRARQLGIGSATTFTGAVPPERVSDLIGNADVFAFPALAEGLGLAVAEALMLGVPVVVTREGGGVADLVPAGPGARVVERAESGQLADAIGSLLRDPSARAAAAERGQALKDSLNPTHVAAVFEETYERVLETA